MIDVLFDSGKGRVFLILQENEECQNINIQLAEVLALKARALIIKTKKIESNNWKEISEKIISKIDELKIRQVSLVARKDSTTIAQNISLSANRLIRTMVLINPTTRAHPTKLIRTLDYFDSHLPMGVPFSSKGDSFDGKSYLQRIRCPVLLLLDNANQYEKSEAIVMSKRIPTCWLYENNYELNEIIANFQDVPAKCPQKNIAN